MRELKFRAWDKDLAKYLEGCEIDSLMAELSAEGDGREVIIKQLCPARYIFEQYTGLTDKNGREIYEGDIVKIYKGRKLDSVLLVQFDELNGEYMWCKNEDIDSAEYGGSPYWAKYLVVGNIHENPELLSHK